jgi:signal transduction histidine kinase
MTEVRRLAPYAEGATTAMPIDQARRVERTVAVARTFVAVGVLVAIVLLPVSAETRGVLPALLAGYVALACTSLALLGPILDCWRTAPMVLHVADVSVAGALTLQAGGADGPFFVLYLFTLLSAASRWGFAATLATTAAALGLQIFHPHGLVLRSTYIALAGLLTAYFTRSEKRFHSEATAIATTLSRVDVRAGLRRSVTTIFDALLHLFDAPRALLVVRENPTGQAFLWEVTRNDDAAGPAVRMNRLEPQHLSTYLFAPVHASWHAVRDRRRETLTFVAIDKEGRRVPSDSWTVPSQFLSAVEPFDQLMSLAMTAGSDWTGRLFVMNPAVAADKYAAIALGDRVLRHLVPAVHNVYLLRRLRAAAGAFERGRIARELHDGVIQTVTGVEMQVAALSMRFADESPGVLQELNRLHITLRQEVARLRDFMQQMRPLDIEPDKLVEALGEYVQRFQRDTGIVARFVTQLDRVVLSPRACREIARILEEALVNIRRHSGARHVFVRLSAVNGDYRLSIDDDGRGFQFAGRLSQADLDSTRKGPLVINERVRQLGGALTVESEPGRGARLEIAVPVSHHGSYR